MARSLDRSLGSAPRCACGRKEWFIRGACQLVCPLIRRRALKTLYSLAPHNSLPARKARHSWPAQAQIAAPSASPNPQTNEPLQGPPSSLPSQRATYRRWVLAPPLLRRPNRLPPPCFPVPSPLWPAQCSGRLTGALRLEAHTVICADQTLLTPSHSDSAPNKFRSGPCRRETNYAPPPAPSNDALHPSILYAVQWDPLAYGENSVPACVHVLSA
jgi:hypothetical protein